MSEIVSSGRPRWYMRDPRFRVVSDDVAEFSFEPHPLWRAWRWFCLWVALRRRVVYGPGCPSQGKRSHQEPRDGADTAMSAPSSLEEQ